MSQLTIKERLKIEYWLNEGRNIQEIADSMEKARSAIVREVRKPRMPSKKPGYNRIPNCCIHRRQCKLKHVCMRARCYRQCSTSSLCNEYCPQFQEEHCSKLKEPPYVCNGCREENQCTLNKQFYIHDAADRDYRKLLVESRAGADITEEERQFLSEQSHRGIQKGQSVHHILETEKDQFTIGEKTVYRYINAGLLRTKRCDMPRSCMVKPRRRKPIEHKIDKKCRIGRTYADFEAFRNENPDFPVVEMDSVIGRPGGKTLLTLQFNNCGMMWLFLRPRNTSQSVIDCFRMLFLLILTDNGPEFSNPVALEVSPICGRPRTKIFYCDPYSAYQKCHVENNHLILRRILEKRTSFDNLEQSDMARVMSHMNSFSRKSLNNIPSITLFETIYGKEVLNKLGVSLVAPQDVILTPDLLLRM